MLLSKKDKGMLRKKLVDILRNVEDGKRVKFEQLPTEVLEQLIFDYEYFKDATGPRSKKKIVLSGEFLRKLDLSEVSFADVCWEYSEEDRVDLSGTNVKIDFSQAFKNPESGRVTISWVNLSGVDLSNNVELERVGKISNSCLDNTNLDLRCFVTTVNMGYALLSKWIEVSDSSLKGVKFPETAARICADRRERSDAFELNYGDSYITCHNSDFSETNLSINFDKNSHGKAVQGVASLIKKGYLTGCQINGKKILSAAEKSEIKVSKDAEYNKFYEEILGAIDSSSDSFVPNNSKSR